MFQILFANILTVLSVSFCTNFAGGHCISPGRVAQSVGHPTLSQGSWVRYLVWQHTFVSPSAFSRRAVVSYWRKYVHEVLVNRLGGLSLPRKSVFRLTDRPDMALDVYRGRKTTMQQQKHLHFIFCLLVRNSFYTSLPLFPSG